MIIFYVIIILYVIVISTLIFGFYKMKTETLKDITPEVKFSIVIPFRDEAENLPELLKSLEQLNYPKNLFEVLLINDNSLDNSLTIVESFKNNSTINHTILNASSTSVSPKKDALTQAINLAKNEWIITTDADCVFSVNWLKSYNQHIKENNSKFIAGPVAYTKPDFFFKIFQLLDFTSLIGVTIGCFGLKKPIMCNGANVGFKKKLFQQLNGYNGNTNLASGDDVFLLEKALVNNKHQVNYLKNYHAIVYTKPVNTFKKLVAQRIRWASKTSKTKSVFSKLLGLLVLATNGFWVILLLGSIIDEFTFKQLLIYTTLKLIIDFVLIYQALLFLSQEQYFRYVWLSSIIYPFFSIYVGVLSLFGGYKWKNRAYKH
ncbi:glycosyltransferase [Aurantibacter sp.]|uniref:glycosyltransferase family 2 protein n=1 Tax=Aurantibacter sp. TaxID=2807103 RepID=UPI0035C80E78